MFSFLDKVTTDIIHYEAKKVGHILPSDHPFAETRF